MEKIEHFLHGELDEPSETSTTEWQPCCEARESRRVQNTSCAFRKSGKHNALHSAWFHEYRMHLCRSKALPGPSATQSPRTLNDYRVQTVNFLQVRGPIERSTNPLRPWTICLFPHRHPPRKRESQPGYRFPLAWLVV